MIQKLHYFLLFLAGFFIPQIPLKLINFIGWYVLGQKRESIMINRLVGSILHYQYKKAKNPTKFGWITL
jgi:hypothetical protein